MLARLTDTLPRRLWLLMLITLVGSHLIAFSLVMRGTPPPPPAGARQERPALPPVLGGLPPTPGLSDGPQLPAGALALDYGVRLLVIALAAWAGGRWLTRPLRQLGAASAELVQRLRRGEAPPQLDATRGTQEVRQLAAAFNGMAAQIQQQFQERALMMAALSHDLRTPITRLRMRLETQTDGERLRSTAIDDLREMSALIDSVLEVFRPQGEPEALQRLDLGALLQALADDAAELGQALTLAPLPAGSLTLQTQPLALRRVLDNLIGNALRYGLRARLSLQREAHGLCLHIDDEGPGIPEALLDEVMQAFVRVDASRHRGSGGVGLGLYIARQLCAGMGVNLRLHNRAEGGLRASLCFSA